MKTQTLSLSSASVMLLALFCAAPGPALSADSRLFSSLEAGMSSDFAEPQPAPEGDAPEAAGPEEQELSAEESAAAYANKDYAGSVSRGSVALPPGGRQEVDLGAGVSAWIQAPAGGGLSGDGLKKAVMKTRLDTIAMFNARIAAAEAKSRKEMDYGLAWYRSNPAVASRVAHVLSARRPAPVSAQEILNAASSGQRIELPELGARASGELLYKSDLPQETPGRVLLIVAAGDKDAAAHQARLELHSTITKAWVRDPDATFAEKAWRLMAATAMLPRQASLVIASRGELQSQLDQRVNPGIAQVPNVAAGVGISRDPGKAATGARRLNSNRRFIGGGGGGPLGRLLNVPARADSRINSEARCSLEEAGREMAKARAEAVDTVKMATQAKRLEAIATAEDGFLKQGIKAIKIADAYDAAPRVGFSYALSEGERYLLDLNVNESALPREQAQSSLPGTPGQRLAVAVDADLASRARLRQLSRRDVEEAWDGAIAKQFKISAAEAAKVRQGLLAGR